MATLQGISVCVWDFDSTLYPPNEAIHRDMLEADYEVVMHHRGWDRERTVREFNKIFLKTTPSSTKAAAELSGISITEAAIECERYKDRRPYLTKDDKLVSLFRLLSGFTHYILANGSVPKIIASLEVIGIPATTFKEIVTAETVGVTKPDPKGFLYIMGKTGLPPSGHIMIGDRPLVDLEPAKRLGWRTALVWNDEDTPHADVRLPTVYDIGDVLV